MRFYPIFEYSNDHLPFEKKELPLNQPKEAGWSTAAFNGETMLCISGDLLRAIAKESLYEISHFLRPDHLAQLRFILDDPEASENDRYVAFDLLRNANIAAGGVLPMCQDTGTAIVMGKKGHLVHTDGSDAAALSQGIHDAYQQLNLRYSQMAPLDMFREKNTGTNLPAQIDLYAGKGAQYELLFVAKGGGSANKSYLFQQTRAVLQPEKLWNFLQAKIKSIGTAACPPYHLAVVIGGTSAEMAMKTLKLASCHYLDGLPTSGNEQGQAFRDMEWEEKILGITRQFGIGAQFGGKYFCHDVRVIRLPRHGASLPIALGVSCSADRQIVSRITTEGVFMESLEHDPARFLPEVEQIKTERGAPERKTISIDLGLGMQATLKTLDSCTVSTRVELNGPLIVARDIAHAKLLEMLEAGKELPEYFKEYPIYYAGPAKTPDGLPSGSFGPTTAGRMDAYVDPFQAHGGSMITLAKGNRSDQVRQACQRHGGFYLGTIGGSAARIAKECITDVKVIDFPELGMEAVWQIEVARFPAFVIIDNKGNDFFSEYGIAVE